MTTAVTASVRLRGTTVTLGFDAGGSNLAQGLVMLSGLYDDFYILLYIQARLPDRVGAGGISCPQYGSSVSRVSNLCQKCNQLRF